MDKAQHLRKYPYVVAGAILLVGLGIPVGTYLTADSAPDDIERFLLQLGAGFAFVERQKRITLDAGKQMKR